MYASKSTITINDCVFADNVAGSAGGAICIRNATSATIVNTSFSGNTALVGNVAYCASGCTLTLGEGNTYSNGNSKDDIEIEEP